MYREEYPRPSFVRDEWMNLNGKWAFQMNSKGDWLDKPLTQMIEVPFCPESDLSGIGVRDFITHVWYRRTFAITQEQMKKSILIHFGAVDFEAKIYINKQYVGEHRGGYVSFSFNITSFVKAGENTIDLEVYDDSRDPTIACGKQSVHLQSKGCTYTRTTGIWQTVWLEFVNQNYIQSCYLTPDCTTSQIRMYGQVVQESSLEVTVLFDNKVVSKKLFDIELEFDIMIEIPEPLKQWDVYEPNLYDIELRLKCEEQVIDTVKTYCGFRTVVIKNKQLYLNEKPLFLRQVLDQGFYPEGIYTAPTVQAIYKDIDLGIAFGFNGARPHQKVFEEHYLYYADHKGYLIWGEYGSWQCHFTESNEVGYKNIMQEWKEIVRRDYNHPSIIGWCPLNEAWGNREDHPCDLLTQTHIYYLTKKLDPTRIVIGASGGDLYKTDIWDFHTYIQDLDELKEEIICGGRTEEIEAEWQVERTRGNVGLTKEELQVYPKFLSEYGGIAYQQDQEGWGYNKEQVASEKRFLDKYCGQTNLLFENCLIGYCYTQLTDVEQEQNGLVYYDRTHKFSRHTIEKIRQCNMQEKRD